VILAVVPLKLPPLNRAELTIFVKTPFAAVTVLRLRLVVLSEAKVPLVKLALVPFTTVEVIKLELILVIFALVPLKLPPLNSAELTILVKSPFAAVISSKPKLVAVKLVKLPLVKLALVPLTIVEVIKLESMLVMLALVPLKLPPLNKGAFTIFE